jgi:hypothetical protein
MASRRDLDLFRAAWRTSTFSNADGACVEVATEWRTSSHSNAAGECVEAGQAQGAVLVRDTKQHGRGQVHRFTAAEWREFIARIKADETVR